MSKKTVSVNFAKGDGLAPAVIQDARTGQVLMLGYMDRTALRQTLRTGRVWFWSRRRRQLWLKGETSGHYFHVVEVRADCDRDALLIQVRPEGPACHTGAVSCFSRRAEPPRLGPVLEELYAVIDRRRRERPPGSYTTSLFKAGLDRMAQKVGEEAIEVVIAAKGRRRARLTSEAADLLYHLAVLLAARGVRGPHLAEELERRRK